MYKASMNLRLIKKYVSFLFDNGLLVREGATYRITVKGMYFLKIYDQLSEMLQRISR
jgi:predicted transcriptional regulator